MPRVDERLRVVEGQVLDSIDPPTNGPPVAALDLEVIDLADVHRLLPGIVRGLVHGDRLAIGAVLVETGEHMQGVLPAAEDGEVAGGVVVRDLRGSRAT